MKNYREVKIGPYSAYAIAKKNGFEGTEEEWLESLKPPAVDKTLTEEGQAADAKVTGAALATKAVIDDTAVGTDAWSSKHIVDMLCPPLEETGNPVVCYPVAGYPLGVKATWEPVQDGSGDPSPDNVRPIKGRDSVTVNQADGLRAWKLLTLDGTEKWEYENNIYFVVYGIISNLPLETSGKCSHFIYRYYYGGDNIFCIGNTIKAGAVLTAKYANVDEWKSYLAAQYAAGTPVQVAYKLAKPVVVPDTNDIFFSEQPAQGGSGDPSPDNIRPILLNNTVQVGQTATLTLPHTIYGGTVDAVTGEGQESIKLVILDGDELKFTPGKNNANFWNISHYSAPDIDKIIVTSHFPKSVFSINQNYDFIFTTLSQMHSFFASADELNAYLAAQYAAGTPVQIAYKLAEPVSFTVTGAQPIPALSGVNTVITDADSVTVAGRADPIKRITDLEDAVASMTTT